MEVVLYFTIKQGPQLPKNNSRKRLKSPVFMIPEGFLTNFIHFIIKTIRRFLL